MGLWDWLFGRPSKRNGAAPGREGLGPETNLGCAPQGVALAEPQSDASDAVDDPAESPWWAPEGATLSDLPDLQPPELTTESLALQNLLASHLDGHDLTLPPLPRIAESLMPKLADAGCNLREVASGLAEDQVIAAAVLRMANSPLYRGLNKIKALPPAVTRLGTRALRTLLLHESLRAATFFQKRGDNQRAKDIWRRSLASGMVMRGLAELTGSDPEEAFLAGLLHDIGNVLVLRILFGGPFSPRYDIDAETFEYLCYLCHQEFGGLLANAWRLPVGLSAIITNHHTYPGPDDPLRSMRLQIRLTDTINALLEYAPYVPINVLQSRAALDLGLTRNRKVVTFLDRLPEDVSEVVTVL